MTKHSDTAAVFLAAISICILAMAGARAEEAIGPDPLEAELTDAGKQTPGGAIDSSQSAVYKESIAEDRRTMYGLKTALRSFFSGDAVVRSKVAVPRAVKALENDRRYVVEETYFNELSIKHDRRTSVLPMLEKTQIIGVVVFEEKGDAEPDAAYLSAGLLANNAPGRKRPLRSDGPFELYDVTIKVDGKNGTVSRCEKDPTFSSSDYVVAKTSQRLSRFVRDVFLLPAEARNARMPKGSDVPQSSKIYGAVLDTKKGPRLSEGGKPPAGPWRVGVLARLKTTQVIPDRYLMVFQYDRTTDAISVISCKRDAVFEKVAQRRQRIAEFVESYLEAVESTRRRLRTERAHCRLPKAGKIFVHSISYDIVEPEGEGAWQLTCRIGHSDGFGQGWRKTAKYWCRVKENGDGKLLIAQDGWDLMGSK